MSCTNFLRLDFVGIAYAPKTIFGPITEDMNPYDAVLIDPYPSIANRHSTCFCISTIEFSRFANPVNHWRMDRCAYDVNVGN